MYIGCAKRTSAIEREKHSCQQKLSESGSNENYGSGDGMSATFWKVFELTISVLENMLLLGFCMDFMQQRPKGKRGKFLWLFAVLVGMIFPALEKYPAIYDRWELWLTLLWLFGYLAVSTRGSILRKIIAAVVARN